MQSYKRSNDQLNNQVNEQVTFSVLTKCHNPLMKLIKVTHIMAFRQQGCRGLLVSSRVDGCILKVIGLFHDDVILLQLPEFISFSFSNRDFVIPVDSKEQL